MGFCPHGAERVALAAGWLRCCDACFGSRWTNVTHASLLSTTEVSVPCERPVLRPRPAGGLWNGLAGGHLPSFQRRSANPIRFAHPPFYFSVRAPRRPTAGESRSGRRLAAVSSECPKPRGSEHCTQVRVAEKGPVRWHRAWGRVVQAREESRGTHGARVLAEGKSGADVASVAAPGG